MECNRGKVVQCPTDALSLTNRVIVNPIDYPLIDKNRNVEITTSTGHKYVFTLEVADQVPRGGMAYNRQMRKWAQLSINDTVDVRLYNFNPNTQFISKITLVVDFMQKVAANSDQYDTDLMSREFLMQFPRQAFTVGQLGVFKFLDKKQLCTTVKEMEVLVIDNMSGKQQQQQSSKEPSKIRIGQLVPNTQVVFEKADDSSIILTGQSKGKVVRQSIINPNWDFETMGIGGLDKEFNAIFRRAFASRVFPPEIIEQLGLKHVRGILLYGPPGTGKTLMARQIGQMLNAREPKIVNGPQILDKYVGESEANIRKLFADAEEEQKRMGINSGLHIIIFDEIDAICKARGSVAGATGVHDTVVNQLLAKIDGVESLNNILVIGMTNRRDMIDEALLRPGRMEVQMEISLPNEHGRLQILNIHTTKMKQFKKLASDVNLDELASLTKNFSGAEIEGLVRAAQSTAMNRLVKADSKVQVDTAAFEKLLIARNDFMHALQHDVKPAFGTSNEAIERFCGSGVIEWGQPIRDLLDDGQLFIQQAKSTDTPRGLVSILLEGSANAGKTALAAKLALESDFPFVKLCSPEDMVGFTETAKCMQIRKVFDDAYKSTQSCILVDDIEGLLDYGDIGARYSNLVLQALRLLLKKEPPPGKKLLILCTTSRRDVLEQMKLLTSFTTVIHVPNLTKGEHLVQVLLNLTETENNGNSVCFDRNEISRISKIISQRRLSIGIKKLLALVDWARQMDPSIRAPKFLAKLEEEMAIV
ncbi:vesicle-fusing ATPase 1-like [Oppia nitens]|uniref:vesicle-fusing ATPase 1-like n=1 Tax=Oppia nitens TaxID=1686743 RepID=UPI0023DCC8CB|nr:vesicle-fusing ATPase 1-like [Oppia nitens]